MTSKQKHYEEKIVIKADAESVFAYADDPTNFSSHMNKSSWMMGGGKMETTTDEGNGQKIGSHIMMTGNVLGLNLFLDEVIIEHNPPFRKAWETVGKLNLIIIDHYKLGFEINPENSISKIRVYIDYNLPQALGVRVLGFLFGGMYAKWCVRQMTHGVEEYFNKGGE